MLQKQSRLMIDQRAENHCKASRTANRVTAGAVLFVLPKEEFRYRRKTGGAIRVEAPPFA
jgi:hypothetical protein